MEYFLNRNDWKSLRVLCFYKNLQEEHKQDLKKYVSWTLWSSMFVSAISLAFGLYLKKRGYFVPRGSAQFNEVLAIGTIMLSSFTVGGINMAFCFNRFRKRSDDIYAYYVENGLLTQEEIDQINEKIEIMEKESAES